MIEPITPTGVAFARQQLRVIDQIDAGQKVAAGADPLGYAAATAAQRASMRTHLEETISNAVLPRGLINRK